METVYRMKRSNLRWLMQQHPIWTSLQLAEAVEMSLGWDGSLPRLPGPRQHKAASCRSPSLMCWAPRILPQISSVGTIEPCRPCHDGDPHHTAPHQEQKQERETIFW